MKNSCLISESRHFPWLRKKKLRNQRNGNKRQKNTKMATTEKLNEKKNKWRFCCFFFCSSSAAKRAISSYYYNNSPLPPSPICIRRPREKVSPYRPLATPTSSFSPLIERVRKLQREFQRKNSTTFLFISYVTIYFPIVDCLLTKEITTNELST
jgi:hypothetical protein